MDKDKEVSAVQQFLGEAGVDKEPFTDTPEDPFKPEVTEEKAEVKEVKEEKPLPFNKDPKVLKFIEKELDKRMANFKPSETEREKKQENDEVVDALVAVIGDDTPEKRRAVQALSDRLNEGTRKITELENQQREAEMADQQAEEELATAFENIEENYDVDFSTALGKKTRQEFASFVEKIAPKDSNGDIVDYPDMTSAWETFQELKKSTGTPSRAKDLASRSMARSSEAPAVVDTKGLNFDNIIEHITKQ